ncbi:MAG TPA: helix-turn-helix domain-containing protein, partial [Chitinophagaceae bacterium]|nr:helix-turn-helix domain-containing protein [Chitinophagaceae bacterium]
IFQAIKRRLPADASVSEEIAKLLGISTDSAYRRMRGEKQISLEELYALCTTYRISLDQLMNIETGAFMFQGNLVDSKTFRFDAYLTGILNYMAYFNSFKKKEIYYMCKDMPIFDHFHFREVAAFKRFFWLKTYLQFPELAKAKFRIADYPDEIYVLDQKILGLYNQIPSVEVWNIESMNIFFRQIDFYQDGQVFESENEVFRLYEALEKLWDHLERQASLGYKFDHNDPEQKRMADFSMYFNEVLLGDNSQLLVLDDSKLAFISHSTINYIMTRDLAFTENLYNHIQNQMKRSTLISAVSEKERSKFFRIIRDRIAKRKEALHIKK